MTELPPDAGGRDLELENARLRRLLEHRGMTDASRHQVRDTLGMIRGIVRRSAAFSVSAGDYAAHLEGRIEALLRVQGAITREAAEGIDLHGILADEFLAHAAHEDGQVRIGGPAIRLRPKAAELFALAAHELTTNAVKFGALGRTEGRIAVDWEVTPIAGATEDRRFRFAWTESVAPRPAGNERRPGFGTDVLDSMLRDELKAHTTLDFRPEGLCCTIALPFTPWVGTLAATPTPAPPEPDPPGAPGR